jgi:hypothetical protein
MGISIYTKNKYKNKNVNINISAQYAFLEKSSSGKRLKISIWNKRTLGKLDGQSLAFWGTDEWIRLNWDGPIDECLIVTGKVADDWYDGNI